MATLDLALMRKLVDDEEQAQMFSDGEVTAAFAANDSSNNATAAFLWRVKAGKVADQIDVGEAGSTRPMSQLQRQALAMADLYQKLAERERTSAASVTYATTRAIERI